MLRTTLPILPPQSPVLTLWVGITQFSRKSNLHLTATVPLAAARLLFNSGERRVFLFCWFPFLKRKKKGKKSKCYKGVLEPHPSEALSAWHRPSVFFCIFLHILNFGNCMFSCGKHTHFIYTVLCLSLSHIPKVRLVGLLEWTHESK